MAMLSEFAVVQFLSVLLHFFFCPVYSKPTGKKTAKHANHMTLRLGGSFNKEDIRWE